jgi:hypothetical protein
VNDIDEQGLAEAERLHRELLAERCVRGLDAGNERRYQILKAELRDAHAMLGTSPWRPRS